MVMVAVEGGGRGATARKPRSSPVCFTNPGPSSLDSTLHTVRDMQRGIHDWIQEGLPCNGSGGKSSLTDRTVNPTDPKGRVAILTHWGRLDPHGVEKQDTMTDV